MLKIIENELTPRQCDIVKEYFLTIRKQRRFSKNIELSPESVIYIK